MRTVRDLHREAMDLAQEAALLRQRGQNVAAREVAARALPFEVEAASLIEKVVASEPTRSILYQSAASLAFHAEDYATAQRLVAEGLSGYPPPRVEQELKDLFEQVNFESHLVVHDEPLNSAQMQLSIAGDSVGFGRVTYLAFDERIRAIISMINRTWQRLIGEPFGNTSQKKNPYFTPLLSAPRAGSFAITIEIVQRSDGQHALLTTGERVVDEVVEGVQLVQAQEFDQLKRRMNDENYLVHFLSHAQVLAPDGDRVKLVGLTTSKRQVAFTQPKESFDIPTIEASHSSRSVTNEPFSNTIAGTLDEAMGSKGRIKLIDQKGKKVTLWVQEGLQEMVQHYFVQEVEVRFERRNGRNELMSITGLQES